MRKLSIGGAVAALVLAACAQSGAGPTVALSGDYVESRTCNVYVGACHANGERVTAGREAMLAWHVTRGSIDGATLDGLNVVAVIAGSDNLVADGCAKTAVIYVDSRASAEQRAALASAITGKYGAMLGRVMSIKSAPIEFKKDGLQTTVRIPNAAYLKTVRSSCDHCTMPHMVWYEPFVGLQNKAIAKASLNEFKGAPELATRWTRYDENSSYVGEFSF